MTVGISSDTDLADEIVLILRNMLKARDRFSRQVGCRNKLFSALGLKSEIIWLGHGIDGRPDLGMIANIGYLSAINVELKIHGFNAVDILLTRFHAPPLDRINYINDCAVY